MNYSIVFKLQSIIIGALAGSFAICWIVSKYYGGHSESDAEAGFALSFLVAIGLSIGFAVLGKSDQKQLFRKEALATIGIGWIIASFIGALPYYLILPEIGIINAVFESASGLTTTGASILSDLEDLPKSLHLWRAMSQWMGGLGVVVFFVAVLSFLGAGAKVLFSRESSAQAADLGTSRVQKGVLQLLQFYLIISVICATAFWMSGLSIFEAIIHMFTTISTGGFSTRSASVAAFENPTFEWLVIVFMAIGGTSFLVIIHTIQGSKNALTQSTEVKGYYLILIVSIIAILVFLRIDPNHNGTWHQDVRSSAFQVLSIMTTTGFATENFDIWLPVTHILLLALMVVGGCSGSTAGGTKVIRFVIAVKVSLQQIEKAFRSRVVRSLKVNGKSVDLEDQETVLIYIVLLGLIMFGSTLIISFLEPRMSFEGTVSAMAACLFNIGPGFAEVGPTQNFAALHGYTKIYLSLLMILGRLELFALLALFSPSLWKHY